MAFLRSVSIKPDPVDKMKERCDAQKQRKTNTGFVHWIWIFVSYFFSVTGYISMHDLNLTTWSFPLVVTRGIQIKRSSVGSMPGNSRVGIAQDTRQSSSCKPISLLKTHISEFVFTWYIYEMKLVFLENPRSCWNYSWVRTLASRKLCGEGHSSPIVTVRTMHSIFPYKQIKFNTFSVHNLAFRGNPRQWSWFSHNREVATSKKKKVKGIFSQLLWLSRCLGTYSIRKYEKCKKYGKYHIFHFYK